MISVVIINKDEPSIDETLTALTRETSNLTEPSEVIVVDASNGRLDSIRRRHEGEVRWLDFEQPSGIGITISHQRNTGVREARGDIIVFIDAGCRPHPGWLSNLVAPLYDGEDVTAGSNNDASGAGRHEDVYRALLDSADKVTYLNEAGTLNFGFHRKVFDQVGGFDEELAYGSDVDFCWRFGDIGFRIRYVPGAVVDADWGTPQRQRRRSYMYGKARARLYRKHRSRLKRILRTDPMVVLLPLFILGLPITLIFPLYPLLLLIPLWRNRYRGVRGAFRALADDLWYGMGVLTELARERVYAGRSRTE